MKRTLKTMTAAECMSERSRHRMHLGHLALARMNPRATDAEKARVAAEDLMRRRRIARLDRRIEIAKQAEQVAA